jgi:hypothetical protein
MKLFHLLGDDGSHQPRLTNGVDDDLIGVDVQLLLGITGWVLVADESETAHERGPANLTGEHLGCEAHLGEQRCQLPLGNRASHCLSHEVCAQRLGCLGHRFVSVAG